MDSVDMINGFIMKTPNEEVIISILLLISVSVYYINAYAELNSYTTLNLQIYIMILSIGFLLKRYQSYFTGIITNLKLRKNNNTTILRVNNYYSFTLSSYIT